MFQTVFRMNPEPVMFCSREDGCIIEVNEAFCLLVGIPKKKVIGKNSHDLGIWHDDNEVREIENTLDSGRKVNNFECRVRTDSGEIKNVLLSCEVFELYNKSCVLNFLEDITDRKRAEEEFWRKEAYFSAIIESIPCQLWTMGPDGRYTTQNRISRERFGDIIGKRPEEVCQNQDTLQIWLDYNRRAFSGESAIGEVKYLIGEEERYFYNVVTPVQDEGKTLGIVGLEFDITDRKLLEIALTKIKEELENQVEKRTKQIGAKNRRMEEFNAALRILLRQRVEDKKELEENILSNVKDLIVPYVNKLKNSRLDCDQMSYLTVLESQLLALATPFAKMLSQRYFGLTPLEVQNAGLIREGKTTQEIAALLCVSENTVSSHRFHIRKKLGLTNKKVNLRTYLKSLDG